ncbi:hypothetical protein [Euzebya sp.]|uniref:hypothetical protein n=1 Tax=Euzebya sp. TaxID=1971409 RepID=UPI0035186F30
MTATSTQVEGPARRAVRLEQFTIGYNVVEGVVAVAAGLAASLVSLVGFGIDSGIEVAAAGVVLHRLLAELRGGDVDEAKERRALRFIALTFFALGRPRDPRGVSCGCSATRRPTRAWWGSP